jgi:hypothetical protein
MLFSKVFELNRTQPELDFIDIDLELDFPLYFDPSTFLNGDDEFAKSCAEDIYDFFDAVMNAIRANDKPRGIELLAALKEPNDSFLGVSKGKPAGRGVGRQQAEKIYLNLRKSKAIETDIITDLSDYAMFIDGIGPDKISDMTTNIIRGRLLQYTNDQCDLLGIPLTASLPSGLLWDRVNRKWKQIYVNRPYHDENSILLIPKRYVKWRGAVNKRTKSYYKHFVRNFIREEQLRTNGPLVQTIKRGKHEERVVRFGDIEKLYPGTKKFLADFSDKHPDEYAKFKKATLKHHPVGDQAIFSVRAESHYDPDFAREMIKVLRAVPAGRTHASDYHRVMVGIVQFLLYPLVTAPKIETPINDRRKLIDIRYVNSAEAGFFRRLHDDDKAEARWVMVECKNYFEDPNNPEVDQLAMRFGPGRGHFGILLYRNSLNKKGVIARCRDVTQAGKGFVVPLDDDDIVVMLERIAANKRSGVEAFISERFQELLG